MAVFCVTQDEPLIFQILWPHGADVIWFAIFWQLPYKWTTTCTRATTVETLVKRLEKWLKVG